MMAVSIHNGCLIFMAMRSHSRECPRRMVLGVMRGEGPVTRSAWTVLRLFVARDSFSDVMPDHLQFSVSQFRTPTVSGNLKQASAA